MNIENLNLIFPYDHILIALIVIIIIFSFWKGFIQSIMGLLTWIGSIIITIYTYDSLSSFIAKQLFNYNLFSQNEYLTNIFSITISIPIIFILTLFILKKIRKFIVSDFDKNLLGTLFDKIFGIFYGILFSYIMISTILIFLNKFQQVEINSWLINNSLIINQINDLNYKYLFVLNNNSRDIL